MIEVQEGRAATKAKHRQAILSAARDLLDQHGANGVSADELAERAGVARRTLFNHFSSLEEVVVMCLETELEAAIVSVETAARSVHGASSPLDDLERSLVGADLPTAIVRIARMSQGPDSTEHQLRLQQRAMRLVADPMARQLRSRHPHLADLDAVLLTTTALNGVSVLAAAWLAQVDSPLDATGRRHWEDLLGHLFSALRHGFHAPESVGDAPASPSPSRTEGA